jgi:hypothetical protein
MKTTKLMLHACAIGAALFGLASPSRAAILYTAPAETGLGQVAERMWCSAVNTSTAPITVTIDGMDYKGDVVSTSGPLTVEPDESPIRALLNGSVYCRFTVSGSARKVVAGAFYARLSDSKLVSFVPAQ